MPGVWVLSDVRGVRVVWGPVRSGYRTVREAMADRACDKEGLLEWLRREFGVKLAVVWRWSVGFVVLPRRWLVERRFAWIMGCAR